MVSGRLLWPESSLRVLTYYNLMCIIDERDPGPAVLERRTSLIETHESSEIATLHCQVE